MGRDEKPDVALSRGKGPRDGIAVSAKALKVIVYHGPVSRAGQLLDRLSGSSLTLLVAGGALCL